MKKIIFTTISLLFCMNLFAFTPTIGKDDELRDDTLFLQIISKSDQLTNLIWSSNNSDEQTIDNAIQLIENLDREYFTTNAAAFDTLNSILNLSNTQLLEEYFDLFSTNWTALQEQYGDRLTEDYILDETNAATQSRNAGCLDGPGYVLCSGAVTAAAIIGHAGCLATFIAAPLCFALVATIQVAGINQCSKEYCGRALTAL